MHGREADKYKEKTRELILFSTLKEVWLILLSFCLVYLHDTIFNIDKSQWPGSKFTNPDCPLEH